jgi:predicted metalloprotease
MKLEDQSESANVEDRRGSGMRLGGGIGLGTIAIAVVAYFLGIDPAIVLEGAQMMDRQAQTAPSDTQATPDAGSNFVRKILRSTEEARGGVFRRAGGAYREPRLVLFTGAVQSACGTGQAAMGPFYCPGDEKIYIDLSFYRVMKERFRAPGDFAQAYVIAHEVGHHVQKLQGTSAKVDAMRGRMGEAQFNKVMVRLELQADCYAGVWGHYASEFKGLLEPGDLEEAMKAAAAIGDDALQRQSQGRVVPESFTHGSSAQRMRWFKRGMDGGDPGACDTFSAREP